MNWNNAFKGSSNRHWTPRPSSLGCIVVGGLAILVLGLVALAQSGAPVVSLRATHLPAVKAGSATRATLEFAVAQGFHINSDHPGSSFLIPTTLRIADSGGVRVTAIHWPRAEQRTFSFSSDPLSVFSGVFPVSVELQTTAHGTGTHWLKGTLRYQACNDTLCRPPASLSIELQVHVAASGR